MQVEISLKRTNRIRTWHFVACYKHLKCRITQLPGSEYEKKEPSIYFLSIKTSFCLKHLIATFIDCFFRFQESHLPQFFYKDRCTRDSKKCTQRHENFVACVGNNKCPCSTC